ncbi:4Fe-4S ferredoxin N-terminal domain-containing protein [Halapricum desulfuricans]|uniref:Fe-S-cluster-containing dehydrogenase component n=1 Tax=Halapricum desulfuricans TaxID=2841257 RepID=A0A897NCC5_9EURY|nr:4Fe-4S ferredoxin N-terminal domain-containing protein [Halapricum desulfuricans]QSG09202.1 Fe-S-cluster-containing dehydrogenase component [Halapricum desulfuricans]QSG12070.1 Fe-S-cluster-containing dehydrogenase component [Halapricum desulfuricans]
MTEHTTDADHESPPDAIPDTDLAADEFDQELGEQLGRDAQRYAEGEMSEDEFYEKYHDALIEEFGEDNRPVARGRDES